MAFGQRKMAQLPANLTELITAVGLSPEIDQGAVWNCHGTPVILHKALERIAEHIGILFDPPQIIEASSQNKIAVVCVSGTDGDKSAWSIGEAAPANNKNEYPWAMAEKRAKDRVILKLIGASGFVYSEEEADSFKESKPDTNQGDVSPEKQKADQFIASVKKKIAETQSRGKMIAWANTESVSGEMDWLKKTFPDLGETTSQSVRNHILSLKKGS